MEFICRPSVSFRIPPQQTHASEKDSWGIALPIITKSRQVCTGSTTGSLVPSDIDAQPLPLQTHHPHRQTPLSSWACTIMNRLREERNLAPLLLRCREQEKQRDVKIAFATYSSFSWSSGCRYSSTCRRSPLACFSFFDVSSLCMRLKEEEEEGTLPSPDSDRGGKDRAGWRRKRIRRKKDKNRKTEEMNGIVYRQS